MERRQNPLILLVFAVSFVFILWVTLFSRVGVESRHFYPPFCSYKAILNGDFKALLENIGNIVLFIPIGIASSLVFQLGIKQSLLIGLLISLIIEACQWNFWLGAFEVDDLIHNTIGTGLGTVLINRGLIGEELILLNRKKSLVFFISLICVVSIAGINNRKLKWQKMKDLAVLNNRDDGTVNLLVLSPDPEYIGETDFCILYNSDGSIVIKGKSKNRAWIEIGRLMLDAGYYSFSGLSGVEENTVAIELEYFDTDQHKYIRLTPDIGELNKVEFKLVNPTRVRALIGVYKGAEGTFTARPVIYQEE